MWHVTNNPWCRNQGGYSGTCLALAVGRVLWWVALVWAVWW